MHWKVFLLVAALALAAFAVGLTAPPTRAATTYISDRLTESAGTTNAFGGGSYRFVGFGSDAAFGVVWGDANTSNSVYIVAIKARYLGVGQIYDANGTRLASDRPVKVYTIYAAQLQNLVEFRDGDVNGVANYSRTYDPLAKTWSNYAFRGADAGVKFVNLTANWVAGNVSRTPGSQYRTWAFNLTATNLPYYNISNKAKLTGTLPLVRFTFHLNASLTQVDNVSVPQWNVTVSRTNLRYTLTDVVRMSDLTLTSAKTVHYDLKWDQLIQGWNYQPSNPVGERRLLLEVGSIVANYVPPEILSGWALIHGLHDDGNATYETDAGSQTADNGTAAYAEPRVFKSPNLDFGGAWTRIARFLWASNSTVDGTNRTVVGQISGGWGFAILGTGGLYYGFVLLTGLSYYGGDVIVHDPTVSSDVMTDLVVPVAAAPTPTSFPWGAAILAVVLIVAVILVTFVAMTRRRKDEPPEAGPPQSPPQP